MKEQHSRRRFRPLSAVERVSQLVTDWSGRTGALITSVVICILWALAGPYMHYTDTWQLIINTLTSLVTFVMVFLIQRSQNKDSLAIQLKLNEIIGALHGASNRLIAIEELSEEELRALGERYQRLLDLTHSHGPHASVSIEAAHSDDRSEEPGEAADTSQPPPRRIRTA